MAMSLAEFEALPESSRHKHGDVREDGAVFRRYHEGRTDKLGVRVYEQWLHTDGRAKRTTAIPLEVFLKMGDDEKFHYRDIREDGRIFIEYGRREKKDGSVIYHPCWVLPEAFERQKQGRAEYYKREDVRLKVRTRAKSPKYREQARIAGKAYTSREENKARIAAAKRKHYVKNKAKFIARTREKLTKLDYGLSLLSDTQHKLLETIYASARRVSRCTKVKFHVDHIIPMSREGRHSPGNLQLLPAALNIRRGNKLPEETPEDIRSIFSYAGIISA